MSDDAKRNMAGDGGEDAKANHESGDGKAPNPETFVGDPELLVKHPLQVRGAHRDDRARAGGEGAAAMLVVLAKPKFSGPLKPDLNF